MAKQRVVNSARAAPIAYELQQWRLRAVPDDDAPLDADDVARLVRDCFAAVGIESDVAQSFSVNTVHYYRRKAILDEPDGRTSAARYTMRHVWQAAGARLAGYLGLVTLAEARERMRDANEAELLSFVADRVADARGRQASRGAAPSAPLTPESSGREEPARPLRAAPAHFAAAQRKANAPAQITATVIPLGGDAMCLIPAAHEALRSPSAARSLVSALAAALGVSSSS